MPSAYGKPKIYSSNAAINVGVLLLPPVQLLDMSGIDLFHMLSKDYMSFLEALPEFVRGMGIDKVNIYYIAQEQHPASTIATTTTQHPESIRLAPMTADLTLRLTATFETPSVLPGQLDVLMVPGPPPDTIPTEAEKAFIRKHFECGTTDIITVCTGIYPAGYAGILDGRSATGPRGLLGDLKSKFNKGTKWSSERWVVDTIPSLTDKGAPLDDKRRPAELWTSAEVLNGLDAVSAYIRAHMPRELGDLVCELADVGDRGKVHCRGAVKENAWWIWLIFRSWMKSGKN